MGKDDVKTPISAAPKFQLYNGETGELLGRTAGSWLKIGIFYIAYFAFLAGLFTASIQIMKSSLSEDKPKLQTRLNIPGLHYFPKIDPMISAQTKRLKENAQVPFFYTDNADSYSFYSDLVQAEKTKYTNMAAAVTKGEKAGKNQNVENYDWSKIDAACGTNYGYDTETPCVMFRLNRVIDWQPVGLFKPEADTIFGQENNGPQKPMVKDATYIRCKSKFIGDIEEGEEPTLLTFSYFGGSSDDGLLDPEFYPYTGKNLQPDYQSPIVAVKIMTGLSDGAKYKVTCNAFAKNIIVDDRDKLGSIAFEIQRGGEAVKTE